VHADTLQRSAENKNFKRSDFYTSLKLKKRIDHLFKSGGKAFGKNLMLRFERSTEVDPPFQVVFAVSRKLGGAPVRNRIKRRLREALFLLLKEGKVKQTGFELAIIPKREVVDLDFSELAADLQSALKRLPKPARLAE
jgi:ribonuclease P protein component